MEERDYFFEGFVGETANEYRRPSSVQQMMQKLFPSGTGRGKYGFDTALAAKRLKVSATTIRRWARGTQAPSKEHLNRLKRRVRNLPNTKSGRRAAIQSSGLTDRFDRSESPGGVHLSLTGYAGPSSTIDGEYVRDRTSGTDLSWSQLDSLIDTYVNHGREAAEQRFLDHMRVYGYPPGYRIHSVDMNSLRINPKRHGR